MQLDDYISALGERLAIPDFKLQTNGTASVQIPDQFAVTIEQSDEANLCLIYAFLDRAPQALETRLYTQMLQANLFGTETSDATLSLDQQSGRVVVHRKLSLVALSHDEFIETWLRLVGVASQWSQRLSGASELGSTGHDNNSEKPLLGQWLSV